MSGTSWRCTDGISSLRPLETLPRHSNKTLWRRTTETSWRRSTETSLGVSFETYLRRRWDVQRNVVTTWPRRPVAGWVAFFSIYKKKTQILIEVLFENNTEDYIFLLPYQKYYHKSHLVFCFFVASFFSEENVIARPFHGLVNFGIYHLIVFKNFSFFPSQGNKFDNVLEKRIWYDTRGFSKEKCTNFFFRYKNINVNSKVFFDFVFHIRTKDIHSS